MGVGVFLSGVRDVILENLGKGYREGMQYSMIGYYVPESLYPPAIAATRSSLCHSRASPPKRTIWPFI
jgi:hypothetical protein